MLLINSQAQIPKVRSGRLPSAGASGPVELGRIFQYVDVRTHLRPFQTPYYLDLHVGFII